MTNAKVICDSVAPHGGRLVTLQLKFPRFILAQFNTYGSIAKNARSSRAVPVEKIIAEVMSDPVVPVKWGKRTKGMVADGPLSESEASECGVVWRMARMQAVEKAKMLNAYGVAKEVVNRLLEPWMRVDVVATAGLPSWSHYLNQRCVHDAQPEHQELARAIGRAIRDSTPRILKYHEWHLPYVTEDEFRSAVSGDKVLAFSDPNWWDKPIHASVRRVRRVSYSPFDGTADTPESDKSKHDESRNAGHWSCFEHQAYPSADPYFRSGRMTGWNEYRQRFASQVNARFDFSSLGYV